MPQIPDSLRRSDAIPGQFVDVVKGLESLALACMDLYHESATARAAWHRASIAADEAEAAESKGVAPFRFQVASAVRTALCRAEDVLSSLYAERVCAYLVAAAGVLAAAAERRSPDLESLTDLLGRDVLISEVREAVQATRHVASLKWPVDAPLQATDFDSPAAFVAELESAQVYGEHKSPMADPPIGLYMDELVLGLERFRVFHILAESAHYALAQVLVPDPLTRLLQEGADSPVGSQGEDDG